MTIPAILTEFGCLSETFSTVDGYEAQRTWLQAGWLFDQSFRDVIAGGFAFEFSTEKANAQADSPYPFTSFGTQNYGLGYYSGENCDHIDIPCLYNTMPNYHNLATQYNATDVSGDPHMDDFVPARTTLPTCPDGFPALADVTWPSDSVESLACPATAQQYLCPNQESSGIWATDAGSRSTGRGESNDVGNSSSASSTKSWSIVLAGIVAVLVTILG